MGYLIPRSDDLAEALRCVVSEQVDAALIAVEDSASPIPQRIHQVRRSCKRLRGLLRIAEPGLRGFAKLDKRVRTAARRLAPFRDATVLTETHDRLLKGLPDRGCGATDAVGERLAQASLELYSGARTLACLEETALDLETVWEAAATLKLRGDHADIVVDGYALTYARARAAMRDAYKRNSARAFHRWRRQVKYHLFHTQLLDDAWPKLMAARGQEAAILGEQLGLANDLSVFLKFLKQTRLASDQTRSLKDQAIAERSVLWEQSRLIGRQLFYQSRKAMRNDIEALWHLAGKNGAREIQSDSGGPLSST